MLGVVDMDISLGTVRVGVSDGMVFLGIIFQYRNRRI
jgi:hypothetical protein